MRWFKKNKPTVKKGVIKMTVQQDFAALVIDLVESKIRELHPDIDAKASAIRTDEGCNSLLIGVPYYDLEDAIVDLMNTMGL